MRVQVVHSGNAWILRRLARYLVDGLPYVKGAPWRASALEQFDIVYYVNFQLCRRPRAPLRRKLLWRKPNARFVGAFFPHREDDEFDQIAKRVDFCVAPSARYADYLREHCNPNAHLIHHGIELDRFVPKLRLGFIGRRYETGRKGDELLRAVGQLPYVELLCTDGKLSDAEIPAFYQQIDYVLITSSIEGGPLCFQEGLLSGKEIISTDVGMVSEFRGAPGVHIYRDRQELFTLLERKLEERLKFRANVQRFSVEHWVGEHDKLFRSLLGT
ncbi:MAG: D-inositol-3-phosphate glycosyltransferase [Pseudomonadota bacterium]|jgi:glycosyltransferase involved in cell wall biosynthesis